MKYYFNIRRLYMDTLSSQCHLDLWPTEWIFQIAILLIKGNNCAKLLWNPYINIIVLVQTNPDGRTHKRTHARNTPQYCGLNKKCFASTMTVSSLIYGRMPHVCVRGGGGVVGLGRNVCLKHNRFLYFSTDPCIYNPVLSIRAHFRNFCNSILFPHQSGSSVFSDCPCFHRSVNLDHCQIILTYFVKISSNFILKLVNMFSLLNTDCRVDLPNFIIISSCSIKADKGLEYIYKHQNLASTVNPID